MKHLFTFLSLSLLFILSFQSKAQTPTGLMNATTMLSQAVGGTIGWNNPLNALLNDGTKTSATALIIGDDTDYLMATGFNIVVPVGMIISGIEVTIVKSGTNGVLYSVTDKDVFLIKGGVIGGTDHALSGKWPSSDQSFIYGSNSDAWGTTWTVADVEASNFGVAISAHLGGVLLPTATINAVSINVYYDTAPLPVSMISFDAKANNGKVDLSWATATETNNHGFTIQRSADGINWGNIGEVLSHAANSTTLNLYTFTDLTSLNGNNYYRLLQTDIDNSISYTKVIMVSTSASAEVSLYPNPANDLIHVAYSGNEKLQAVSLLELTGRVLQTFNGPEEKQELIISTADLAPGEYLLSMASQKEVTYKRVMVGH